MIWINKNFDLFSKADLDFLQNKVENFTLSESPNSDGDGSNKSNSYYRDMLDIHNEPQLSQMLSKVVKYVKDTTEVIGDIKVNSVSINKVFEGSNTNDGMHKDMSELTFILYLNDNFDGGEFEYLDDKKQRVKIKPNTNLAIVSNNKLNHRVLPVTNGERYSLIMFISRIPKKENSLI